MKRYRLYHDHIGDCFCEIVEDSDGGYCDYNETKKLQDRVKELEDGVREAVRCLEYDYPTGAFMALEDLLPKEKKLPMTATEVLANRKRAFKEMGMTDKLREVLNEINNMIEVSGTATEYDRGYLDGLTGATGIINEAISEAEKEKQE